MVRWLVGFLCGAAIVAGAAGQVDSPAEKQKQSIEGKVVDARSGEPLRKVQVQIFGRSAESQGPHSMVTGADGTFEFDGLAAGRYTVMLERAGYVQAGSSAEQKTLTVQAGQNLSGVVLRMQAAGIITGKIMDVDGDPVAGVNVNAAVEGPRSMVPGANRGGNGTTNDLGEYRIAELRPGKYLVQAHPSRRGAMAAERGAGNEKATGRLIEAATYYPGTADKGQAIAVPVRSGEEASANFALVMSRAYRVRGTVAGVPSEGMAQLILETVSGGHEVANGNRQLSVAANSFDFEGVLPGTYRAMMITFKGMYTAQQQRPDIQMVQLGPVIEVDKADVEVQLHAQPGVLVKGKLRLDTGEKFDWTQLNVTARAAGEGDEGWSSEGAAFAAILGRGGTNSGVNADGTFEWKEVPAGNYELLVAAHNDRLHDYFVKAVKLNGADVTDSGFAVGGGELFLDVVVCAKGAVIEGTVVDSKGQPVPDAFVVAVPDTEKRARADSYQQQVSDGAGHFVMRGLNPGSFRVLAFEELLDDWHKTGFLKMYAGKGETAELEEGGKKSVTVKIIVAEGEQ